MAEWVCRALRDGSLEGEHAPALTIKDSISSAFGFDAFCHVLCSVASNILSGKAQAQGIVLVAFEKSPSFYIDSLKKRGITTASSEKWIWILDCYSDPLGWKDGTAKSISPTVTLNKEVRNLDKLFTTIISLGKGMMQEGKSCFSVAIDSVSVMLRHASLSAVAGLITNLRSHDRVSCLFWLIHSDLYEARSTAVLEYISSMVASLEPLVQSAEKNIVFPLQNSRQGKFNVRSKRRNGRVKIMCEEYHVEQGSIDFKVSSGNDENVNQKLLPKLQFNLQLSEKELADRENVVLPFEHQGDGQNIQIYDGRRSLLTDKHDLITSKNSLIETEHGKGEIHYLRDSDDERPDSDEDPDDDLDI